MLVHLLTRHQARPRRTVPLLAAVLAAAVVTPAAAADGRVANLAREAAAGQQRLSYGDLWSALEYTDQAPGAPGHVVLFYSGRHHPAGDKVSGRLNPDHGPDSWNREHVWPRSRGFRDDRALAHNDLHHIRATDVTCNADRAALDFDEGGRPLADCRARADADSFEPDDAIKGDVARMLFYMDVRYNGGGGTADLRLVPGLGDPRAGELGDLCTLLAWHAADPVDAIEAERHARIVEVQGNRNPFVDRPDLAGQVFGAGCE